MTRVRDEVEALSLRVVDEQSVDWAHVSIGARTGEPAAIQGLQILGEIIHGFRHAQVAADARPAARRPALFTFAGLDVIEPIGRGASADVFLAYDPMLDLDVALKLRHAESPSLAHQFIAEARRQARVRHPGVASVFGAAIDGGRAGIWMERVRGESLAHRLRQGALTAAEAASIGIDLCAALAAVHRAGIVHGDIKAENVLSEPGGRIVLADFGAGSDLSDEAEGAAIACTLSHVAPEVIEGEPRSPASDIYALGVLLYQLIGGCLPFEENDAAALLAQQRRRVPPLAALAPHAPLRLVRVVERCLDAQPQRRPASALVLARELTAAAAAPASRHRRMLRAMAIVVVLVLGAALAWVGSRPGEASWQSEVTLYRVVDGRGAPIRSGEGVEVGDGLQLGYESNEPSWVYVLDDDGSGAAAALFPAPQVTPQNPLAAATRVLLPQSRGEQLSWSVGSDGERDELLVIAATAPLPTLESRIAGWRRPERAADSQRSATTLRRARAPDALDSAALREVVDDVERLGREHARYWVFRLPRKS